MSTTKRSRSCKSKWSWWHLFLILTGGGAGISGWRGWDDLSKAREALVKAGIVKPEATFEGHAVFANGVEKTPSRQTDRDRFSKPGTFVVRIHEIRLDPTLFKGGHTLDIQAKVVKKGLNGRETDAWESKPYGTRLALVGRDDLVTGWPNVPFEVVWTPGDRFVVEVYDRGGFLDAKSFLMEQGADPNVFFPLQSGPHTLTLVERNRSASDPRASRILIESVPKSDSNSSVFMTAESSRPSREPLDSTRSTRRTASQDTNSREVKDRNIQIR